MSRFQLRWMIRTDLPEILAIEKASFEWPWGEDEFVRALRNRECCGMVCEIGTEIVGYMIYCLNAQPVKPPDSVRSDKLLEVLNIAVAEKYRRSGIGGAMISKLISKLEPPKRRRIIAEVRETNLVAQCFLRSMDFKAVVILKNWYEDTDEPAYGFQYVAEVGVDRDSLSRCVGK